jgi:hypothetical protein
MNAGLGVGLGESLDPRTRMWKTATTSEGRKRVRQDEHVHSGLFVGIGCGLLYCLFASYRYRFIFGLIYDRHKSSGQLGPKGRGQDVKLSIS